MWRNIEGFSNYKVNRDGEVWRFHNGKKHKMALLGMADKKSCNSNHRFFYYKLKNDEGKTVRQSAAKLIATAFYGKPPNENYVAIHKNGIIEDMSVINLAWANKTIVGKKTGYKSGKRIVKIDEYGEDVAYYSSVKEASNKNHLSSNCIRSHCTGIRQNSVKLKKLIAQDGFYYAFDDDIGASRRRIYKDIKLRKGINIDYE